MEDGGSARVPKTLADLLGYCPAKTGQYPAGLLTEICVFLR